MWVRAYVITIAICMFAVIVNEFVIESLKNQAFAKTGEFDKEINKIAKVYCDNENWSRVGYNERTLAFKITCYNGAEVELKYIRPKTSRP